MAAKQGFADFVEFQLREIGFDLQITGNFLQGGFGDFPRALPTPLSLDIVNLVRSLVPVVRFNFGREALQFCHGKVSFSNQVKSWKNISRKPARRSGIRREYSLGILSGKRINSSILGLFDQLGDSEFVVVVSECLERRPGRIL